MSIQDNIDKKTFMNEVKTCDNCGYRKKAWFWGMFSEDQCMMSGNTCVRTLLHANKCNGFEAWMPTEFLLKKWKEKDYARVFSEDDIDLIGKG